MVLYHLWICGGSLTNFPSEWLICMNSSSYFLIVLRALFIRIKHEGSLGCKSPQRMWRWSNEPHLSQCTTLKDFLVTQYCR